MLFPLGVSPFYQTCTRVPISPHSHQHLLLVFYDLGMVLITAFCTMSLTSIHSSSGTLSIRSNPLNLLLNCGVGEDS